MFVIHRRDCRGFSLLELAVAMVVIMLLVGSLLVPLSSQVDNRRYGEAEKQLEEVREASIGFALANRYLPCPAVSASDGREDRSGTTCTKRVGFVPWTALGVRPADLWDTFLRYSVAPNFADSGVNTRFSFASSADIQICAGTPPCGPSDPTPALTNADVPVILISHGKNGYGGTGATGLAARATPPGWTGDEQTNATATQVFVSRTRSDNPAAAGGEFDDVVVWISRNQLFGRMVSASQLP